jgi:hypothetical protein
MEEKNILEKKHTNGSYYRRCKNIMKQYGRHMKAHEEIMLEMRESDTVVELFKKFNLPLTSIERVPSVIHMRWGLASRGGDNLINEVADIEDYIKNFEEVKNGSSD